MPDITRRLARLRVPLGFAFGVFVFLLARPTRTTLAWGLGVAAIGEAIRLWAAGHVEKGREVTSSGPYRWTRHPLYVGSIVIGVGLAIVCNSSVVAAIVLTYLALTLTAAVRTEEAWLRATFGAQYDAYCAGRTVQRRFSMARAMRRNREYRTLGGLLLAALLLALKIS
ncbi:MAG: methyltransferase family protein [Bacteroidales bacterium]